MPLAVNRMFWIPKEKSSLLSLSLTQTIIQPLKSDSSVSADCQLVKIFPSECLATEGYYNHKFARSRFRNESPIPFQRRFKF